MRAVTPEEIKRIAGGWHPKSQGKFHTLLKNPSKPTNLPPTTVVGITGTGSLPPITVSGSYGGGGYYAPPPPPTDPPPGDGGGGGTDPTSAAAQVAENDHNLITKTLDIDLNVIFSHENSSATYVTKVSGGHLTVGYGVDLADLSPALLADSLDAGYISQTLYNQLSTLVTATGTTADNDLASDAGVTEVKNSAGNVIGYAFPASDAQSLTNLSEVVYGSIMQSVTNSYESVTAESIANLPSDIQTAMTDVAVRFGPGGITDNVTNSSTFPGNAFWDDATNGRWSEASGDLTEAASTFPAGGDRNRLVDDAALIAEATGGTDG